MDHTVSTAEAQINQVPHTRVSIRPKTVPSNSKNGMATICTVVLSLPTMCTATLLVAPMMAIHSRKEEIAIDLQVQRLVQALATVLDQRVFTGHAQIGSAVLDVGGHVAGAHQDHTHLRLVGRQNQFARSLGIDPVVRAWQNRGASVSGPHAPDTVFMRARQGEFDVVLAMYHDQGLIPVKLLGLEHGVNTTLGLPFVRTSPDHGTAFDLAGTGRASAASLLAAWDAAS